MKNLFLTEHQMQIDSLIKFINEQYIVRNNVLYGVCEIRKKNSDYSAFHTIDKRAIASITLDAIGEGIDIKKSDVQLVLDSTFAPDYNPVEDFLDNTGKWDGHDYIGDFARRIHTCNPIFYDFFHKWFVGMVAVWKNVSCVHANDIMPILIGTQGCGKSTFCRLVLPPHLRYAYAERMPFSVGAEMERSLGRYLLINIDEFDQLSPRKQAMLKNYIQTIEGKVRKLYSNNIVDVRRYANFIATTNQLDVLSDPTGSRRFICVEVEGLIDVESPVNYNQMYAQALAELRSGFTYWLTKEDEKRLEEQNSKFRQVSPLMQLFSTYFTSSVPDQPESQWMTPLEIIHSLNSLTRSNLDCNKSINLGRELHGAGFKSKRLARGIAYCISPATSLEEIA